MIVEIKGIQFGVQIKARSPNDPHVMIHIISEYDGYWDEAASGFDNYWLDDLIGVLKKAKKTLKLDIFKEDLDGYGSRFV